MYKASQEQQASGDSNQSADTGKSDNVTDVDFEEVKEE